MNVFELAHEKVASDWPLERTGRLFRVIGLAVVAQVGIIERPPESDVEEWNDPEEIKSRKKTRLIEKAHFIYFSRFVHVKKYKMN